MPQVDFGEQGRYGANQRFAPKEPPLVKLVMKLGLAKTASGANKVLVTIGVIALVVMIYVIATQFTTPEPPPLPNVDPELGF